MSCRCSCLYMPVLFYLQKAIYIFSLDSGKPSFRLVDGLWQARRGRQSRESDAGITAAAASGSAAIHVETAAPESSRFRLWSQERRNSTSTNCASAFGTAGKRIDGTFSWKRWRRRASAAAAASCDATEERSARFCHLRSDRSRARRRLQRGCFRFLRRIVHY